MASVQSYNMKEPELYEYTIKGSTILVSFKSKELYEKWRLGQITINFDPTNPYPNTIFIEKI